MTTSSKARTRATMSAELLDAHEHGDVRVVIGRASDFIVDWYRAKTTSPDHVDRGADASTLKVTS